MFKANKTNSGVYANVLATTAIDREFEHRSSQTKYYQI